MELKDLEPLSKTEKVIAEKSGTEEEAVAAIVTRREYLQENGEYISALIKEQYKGRFQCRNEKETATMPILQQEDY